MDALREWMLRLTGAAVLSSAALALTPSGAVKNVLRLVCGVLTITALLSAAVHFDMDAFSRSAAQYRAGAEEIIRGAEEEEKQLLRKSIEQQCAAYIWDKANSLQINLEKAEVSAEWSEDGYWYPTGAVIVGSCSMDQQLSLAVAIEAELGIKRENQIWRIRDEA